MTLTKCGAQAPRFSHGVSAEQKARLDAVAAMPDQQIDYSDAPPFSESTTKAAADVRASLEAGYAAQAQAEQEPFRYEIMPRPADLGGGWQLRLLDEGTWVNRYLPIGFQSLAFACAAARC